MDPTPQGITCGETKVSKPRLIAAVMLGVFWMMALMPFILQEISYKLFDRVWPYLGVIADALLIIIGLWLLRRRSDILMLASFILISAISTLALNGGTLLQYLNGCRYYLPMILLIPVMRYMFEAKERRDYFLERMDFSLEIFLWVQAPCLVWQMIRYGVGDHGGGSMGNYMSGVTSTLIYTISFYLMLHRWRPEKDYFANLRGNWILVVLLLPTFLNETKISFVMMAMYFFLLVPMRRGYIKTMLLVAPAMALALGISAYIYVNSSRGGDNVFNKEYIDFYLMGDEASLNLIELLVDQQVASDSEGIGDDFARGLKFAALPLIARDSSWAPWLGFGIGQFKGGSVFRKTGFAMRYDWLVKGTQMMGMIWFVELGWAGIAWAIAYFFLLFRWGRHVPDRNMQLSWFLGLTALMMVLYGSCFLQIPFAIIFIYVSMLSSRWELAGEPRVESLHYRSPDAVTLISH